MSNGGLSPPGSSVYSSNTLHVGDGTWDSERNTFLLPNLQGLNLATTQYNGMGNRFKNMPGYHSLIKGHGIIAAITFLFIVPMAILIARFYHKNPRMALRLHIWLQIMTVLLSTALFVLGFQAVGAERSLTNPHHGIGIALYTMVMAQAFAGCLIHRTEKGKERFKIPLKLMLHQWIGRAIAILGIVQVALGLTLYGSPKILFILFAVWCLALLIAYFYLSWKNQPDMGFDDQGTYITDRTESTRRRGHGIGKLATAGAAGAGLAALASRRRSRSRSRTSRPTVLSSRHSSRLSDSYADEKFTEDGRQGGTWKNKLFGAAAAGGAFMAVRSLFNRKKKHPATETGSDVSYSRPLGPSEFTQTDLQTDLSRLEEGRAPASPARNDWRRDQETTQASALTGSPLRHGHRPHRSGASISSYDSRTSFNDDLDERPQESHGLRNGIAALGALGFLKHQFSKRKNKKEDAHVEAMKRQDLEEERIARKNSQRRKYTGDGAGPPRRNNRPPSTIFSESELSTMTPAPRPNKPNKPPPPSNIPHPPRSTITPVTTAGPSTIPPPPVMGVLSDTDSEAGGRHHRPGTGGMGAAVGGAAAAAARDHSRHRSSNGEASGVASPPVSVKVKMHNDGRHVTLRRLNEEEAAAERDARRRDRQRRNKNGGSASSISNFDNDRWRRTEALEAQQAAQMQQQQNPSQSQQTIRPGPPSHIPMPEPMIPGPPPGPPPMQMHPDMHNLPPPPPIPAAGHGHGGSILSNPMSSPPGTGVYGTETDVSNYDTNRRRRRAERAQAKQARQSGSRVEFS